MAEIDGKTTDVTGEGRVVIRDIVVPKSVTLPPWFTDLAKLRDPSRRVGPTKKPRPA